MAHFFTELARHSTTDAKALVQLVELHAPLKRPGNPRDLFAKDSIRHVPEASRERLQRPECNQAPILANCSEPRHRRETSTCEVVERICWWLNEEDADIGVVRQEVVNKELIPSPDLVPALERADDDFARRLLRH